MRRLRVFVFVSGLVVGALCFGCTSDTVDLLVDVKTDLGAGAEFVAVRAERFDHVPRADELALGTDVRERRVDVGEAFDVGQRAAHYDSITPGKHVLRVRLIGPDSRIVLERVAIFSLASTSVFTLVMTRTCRGTTCPGSSDGQNATACVGGLCVPPECTPESPETCVHFSCEVGTSCVVNSPCGFARCTEEGICLRLGIFERCPRGQWCDPDEGCQPLPVLVSDSGVAPPPDGGAPTDGTFIEEDAALGGSDASLDSTSPAGDAATPVDGSPGSDAAIPEGPVYLAEARVFDGSGIDTPAGLAVDSSGAVYLSGSFNSPSVDFGGGPILNQGAYDIFVVSLDSAGRHVWSKGFGGTAIEHGGGLSISPQGILFMTGTFYDTLTLGGPLLQAQIGRDLFTSRFDLAGNHRWSASFAVNSASGVATDAQSNLFISGTRLADFGGGRLTGFADNGYVASFDVDGGHRVSFPLNGDDLVVGSDIAVDAVGNLYVAGYFRYGLDFGGGPVANQGGAFDIFVASFDTNGTHRWSKGFGSAGLDQGSSVALDAEGNLYVGGEFEWGTVFGTSNLDNAGLGDGFLASFDTDGNHRWSVHLGGTDNDSVSDLATDSLNNVYVTGTYRGGADLGGGPLTAFGGDDVFVASFDSRGNHRWSVGYGSTANDPAGPIAVAADGTVYVAFAPAGTIDFGTGAKAVSGVLGIALLKLTQP